MADTMAYSWETWSEFETVELEGGRNPIFADLLYFYIPHEQGTDCTNKGCLYSEHSEDRNSKVRHYYCLFQKSWLP